MQGQLFTQDFLLRGIETTPPWQALSNAQLQDFTAALQGIYAGLHADSALNEAQTEQLVIERVLAELGWGDDYLPQVNLSGRRREDVPDVLLFPDAAAKASAIAEPKDDRRYRHGLAILEAKRWRRALDRGDAAEAQDPDAPSSQMLRYLSRVDVVADRALKWGVLTNGALWRLYWQDARSRAEEFFEIDVAAALGVPGTQRALDDPPPAHALKLFFLFFNRAAFLTQTWDDEQRSFHAYARGEARRYEERVSRDLGERVFDEIFPKLAQALARGDLEARTETLGHDRRKRRRYTEDYLEELREATLILLYRLLFLFYAEDRLLLPVHDARYKPYSVRALRERVREDIDGGKALASRLDPIWRDLQGAFLLIDEGDDAVGMPAYNGGLFERARSLLLERTRVPDAVMAPIIDTLSRRSEGADKHWINYRDLSVSHLGGIYERLLEYTLVHEVQAADGFEREEIDRVLAQPASFARKVSGSYYTHDDLVRLLLRESVGRLCDEALADFGRAMANWRERATLSTLLWNRLDGDPERGQRDALDPATRMLELTVCDPAMGSGHFLVTLVDYLADRVLEAASIASQQVNAQPWAAFLAERGTPWVSPVLQRVAHIRRSIRTAAAAHHWSVSDAQLDDRQIVRRMILKKCIYGVDKNAMAVELAKTALWLHTFTVGAPLSFLDHHLKHGDSLHGERLPEVQQGLQALGLLFQQGELDRLAQAAASLSKVADLTDVDIAEVRLSRELAREADAQVAPLHALLDFWRALRWLLPGWPVDRNAQLQRLGDEATRLGLAQLLDPQRNLAQVVAAGELPGADAANALLQRARALAARERFFHWWTAFPTVFAADGSGGFDVVVGNPPWDRIKLQEVEWFAERERSIAAQARAADRKRLIAELQKKRAPLWEQYSQAVARAEANARVLTKAGDYPLLGGGDVNLYSLFVERANALVAKSGIVALLTPSGIAADKGAMPFFGPLASAGRLGLLYDFENRGIFFPDVHDNFKFVSLVFGGPLRSFEHTRCAYYLRDVAELADDERVLLLDAEDFALVNPNTGAAPVFRTRRDAELTLRIYRLHPVLIRHTGTASVERVWPIRYQTTFHMTNDSASFLDPKALKGSGWVHGPANRWHKEGRQAVPLLVGKTIWHYDHRANHASVNEANVQVASSSRAASAAEHADPGFVPDPQYWVEAPADSPAMQWAIGFRDITNPTNVRTVVAAVVPYRLAGNTLPLLLSQDEGRGNDSYARWAPLLLANLNSMAFDYVTRQKAKWTHLNWFILEQLPVIAPARFEEAIGGIRIADFVREQVLHLSYTAHDLAPFARDLGYVDARGQVLPPVIWDEDDRRRRMAALDGLFMHLYGLDEEDAQYILGTFPIVREQDERACGHFRTRDDVLAALRRVREGRLTA